MPENRVQSHRFRSAILSIIFCSFLLGPSFIFLAHGANIQLPGWLTSEDASYLSGGIEETGLLTSGKPWEYFGNGFRKAAETEIENYIPTKSFVLLANAALQREAIAASNILFQWPCYPTSFGATHVYIPSQHAVAAWPRSVDPVTDKGLDQFAQRISETASSYPQTTFITYIVASSDSASSNPAQHLVSSAFSANQYAERLEKAVGDSCTVLSTPQMDSSAYYERFFRSDHHWRSNGASEANKQIADALGKETDVPLTTEPVAGPKYSGAYSRNSLCIVEDEPTKLQYNFDSVLLKKKESQETGNEHPLYRDADETNKHWRFYDLFYDSFASVEGTGSGTALLISDSFGYALLRPLGTEFQKLECMSNLHASVKSDDSLEAVLNELKPDTVIFVAHPSNFSSFCSRNPNFFAKSS